MGIFSLIFFQIDIEKESRRNSNKLWVMIIIAFVYLLLVQYNLIVLKIFC